MPFFVAPAFQTFALENILLLEQERQKFFLFALAAVTFPTSHLQLTFFQFHLQHHKMFWQREIEKK